MQRYNGGRLADDLLERGWRQADLARASGLHVATVSRALNSITQNAHTWARLAHALGKPLRRYLQKAACLALVCGLLSGCATTKALRISQGAYVASQAADVATTHQALRAGAVEANPLLPSDWRAQLAVKTAESAAVLWLSERLSNEHPRWATVLVSAISGAYIAIAAHNYRLSQRGTP